MVQFMENACKEYLMKQFEEMRKSKSKSTLNHSLLSVITLTGFFTVGIFIGLVIVLVKGKTFRKNKKSDQSKNNLEKKTNDKKPYTSVQQVEQIV